MPFHHLEEVHTDPRYCYIEPRIPCDFIEGLPARPTMERLGLKGLDLQMEDEGGLELGDYVSNTSGILALRRGVADAILAGFDVGEHELIPARLINEKGRVHSDDYAILNPLGELDIIDRERSDVSVDEDYTAVNTLVPWAIHARLIPAGRDLFRALGLPGYIFSERLVAFIEASTFSNFAFRPVELSGA